jgi:hypothetical protein
MNQKISKNVIDAPHQLTSLSHLKNVSLPISKEEEQGTEIILGDTSHH